jgi:hypothetical protein
MTLVECGADDRRVDHALAIRADAAAAAAFRLLRRVWQAALRRLITDLASCACGFAGAGPTIHALLAIILDLPARAIAGLRGGLRLAFFLVVLVLVFVVMIALVAVLAPSPFVLVVVRADLVALVVAAFAPLFATAVATLGRAVFGEEEGQPPEEGQGAQQAQQAAPAAVRGQLPGQMVEVLGVHVRSWST